MTGHSVAARAISVEEIRSYGDRNPVFNESQVERRRLPDSGEYVSSGPLRQLN